MTSWLEMDTSSVLISITSQEAENPRIINEIMRVCQQSEILDLTPRFQLVDKRTFHMMICPFSF